MKKKQPKCHISPVGYIGVRNAVAETLLNQDSKRGKVK